MINKRNKKELAVKRMTREISLMVIQENKAVALCVIRRIRYWDVLTSSWIRKSLCDNLLRVYYNPESGIFCRGSLFI